MQKAIQNSATLKQIEAKKRQIYMILQCKLNKTTDSLSLEPFKGFSGNVVMVCVAESPSPTRVTPARLKLYLVSGVRSFRWCLVADADTLKHSDKTRQSQIKPVVAMSELSTLTVTIGKKKKKLTPFALFSPSCGLIFTLHRV